MYSVATPLSLFCAIQWNLSVLNALGDRKTDPNRERGYPHFSGRNDAHNPRFGAVEDVLVMGACPCFRDVLTSPTL